MDFQIGDKVRFLDDTGGGKIARIEDKVIYVSLEEGFEIPYLENELINTEEKKPDRKIFVREKIKPPEKKIEIKKEEIKNLQEIKESSFYHSFEEKEIKKKSNNNEINIFFAFLPKEEDSSNFDNLDVYLINDSNYNLLYNYAIEYSENHVSRSAGILESNTKFFIETYKRSDLNELSTFIFQIIAYKNGIYNLQDTITKKLKIKPIKFYKEKNFVENDFFYSEAIIFKIESDKVEKRFEKLDGKEIKKIVKEKENNLIGNDIKKEIPEEKEIKNILPLKEIDLHIKKLIPDDSGLSSFAILTIQLNRFRSELGSAIINNLNKIIFIHGVGNGVLKEEIRKILDKDYKHFKHQDASFKEYGYGATLVILNES